MHIINADLLDHAQGTLKFILNDSGIYFFPATQQHRDTKSHGLSYEDDYRGNAVAGIVMPERVEISFTRPFQTNIFGLFGAAFCRAPSLPVADWASFTIKDVGLYDTVVV